MVAKVLETYALATLAMRPEADWGMSEPLQYFIGILNTEGPVPYSYLVIFYVCLLGSIAYVIALYHGVVRIKSNHFGYSEGGLRPARFTWDFVSVQWLIFMFAPGSVVLFKCMLDTFSCDYAIVPTKLYQYDGFVCGSPHHNQMMVLASLIVSVMYPCLTFLAPNT